MTSSSSSILVCFKILITYFALNCDSHSQDLSQGHDVIMGRKEMEQWKEHGQEQEQSQGKKREHKNRNISKNRNNNENNSKKRNANNGGKVKGMFVFGSSLVDNGNNIFLRTLTQANTLPYGLDSPRGPTGRFTNAKTVIDVFSDYLKLPLVPPFKDPSTKGEKIVKGVNFASGGSGILDLTGKVFGQVTCLNEQINNFESTLLPELKGEIQEEMDDFLANYIFVIGAGGNDYTMNYFLSPFHVRTLEHFTSKLIDLLTQQLKKLHFLGARKFVLMGAYPLGCYPYYRNETCCNEDHNEGATFFNSQLKSLIDNSKRDLPGSHFVYVDTFNIVMDLIRNPFRRGFKDEKNSCCELGKITITKGTSCKNNGKVCKDRNEYVFFDAIHPTEAVNLIIGDKAFTSNLPCEVYPINLSQLSSL